jgi:Tfp pilus assembly protein PilZ
VSAVLVLDVGVGSLEPLAIRIRRLGLRVVRGKTTDAAQDILGDRRFTIGAIVIPPDVPAADLGRALEALQIQDPDRPMPVLVSGLKPDDGACDALRGAGVDLALFEPIDDHTLRFQLNRALAEGSGVTAGRRALRVPANWPVRVRVGHRNKEARLYTISSGGAYLATPRPSSRGAQVLLTLPLPSGPVEVGARVVMTNVPGNLVRSNLPLGMGVQFTALAPENEGSIRGWTETRASHLHI